MLTKDAITTLQDANQYLKQHYGVDAALVGLVKNGETRYVFENVLCMQNYPSCFKTVIGAMNCLMAHQKGWVASDREQKRQKRVATSNDFF